MIRFEQLMKRPHLLSCLTPLSLAGFMTVLAAFEADLAHFEGFYGFAHRASADAELLRPFHLCRQWVARL